MDADADADLRAGEAASPRNLRASPHASAGTDSIASNMDSPSRGFPRVGHALPHPSTPSHRGADTGSRLSSPSKTLARVSGDFSVELPREPPLPGATPIVITATNEDSLTSAAKKHGATFSVIELPEHAKRRAGGGFYGYLVLVVLVVAVFASGLVGTSYFGSSSGGEALVNPDQQRAAEQRAAEQRAAEQKRAAEQRAAAEQKRQKQEAEAKRSATLEALSAGIPSPDIHLSQQGGSRALRAQWLD